MAFKVGDKVIPLKKSVGISLIDSSVWQQAQRDNQPYLYLRDIVGKECSCSNRDLGLGDKFLLSDIIPFVTEFIPGQRVYVSDESLADALAEGFETTFIGMSGSRYLCLSEYSEYDPEKESLDVFVWKFIVPVSSKSKSISMKISDSYEAEIFADKVVVGCQTIPVSTVETLYKTLKNLQNGEV